MSWLGDLAKKAINFIPVVGPILSTAIDFLPAAIEVGKTLFGGDKETSQAQASPGTTSQTQTPAKPNPSQKIIDTKETELEHLSMNRSQGMQDAIMAAFDKAAKDGTITARELKAINKLEDALQHGANDAAVSAAVGRVNAAAGRAV